MVLLFFFFFLIFNKDINQLNLYILAIHMGSKYFAKGDIFVNGKITCGFMTFLTVRQACQWVILKDCELWHSV